MNAPPIKTSIDRMRPDLGARGVVAVLTPAENPTVEPELSVLTSPDVNLLTARMLAPAPEMLDRLTAYETQLERWLTPFGDAPLDAVVFACTGSSYLLEQERRHPLAIQRGGRPCPVVGAASAIEQGLQSLGAGRIVLVSPYPSSLTAHAAAYWSARGYQIAAVIETAEATGAGHPIYSKTAETLLAALRQAARQGPADAIVAMGTGAPSLPALAVASLETSTPILSSNLAAAWALDNILSDGPGATPLAHWLRPDAPWRERLWNRFPAVRDRIAGA